ncbi:MAG: hypothetical protein R3B06_14970 [Kofleriaceae bacterium]
MKSDVTYFLCGIRVAATTGLTITPSTAPAAWPTLHVVAPGGSTAIAAAGGGWSASLVSGDHIVYLEGAETTWPGLTLALTAAGTLVTYKDELVEAWGATTATQADPKNPWPPPGKTEALANDTWFKSTFEALLAELQLSKGA